tara:strand:- start:1645 stop:3393 length:1749 start_codon:yes stop_codon:yes gene_type:complete
MATLAQFWQLRLSDRPGWKLYHYSAGTTTAKDVYRDQGKTTPLSQPATADSGGWLGLYGDGKYRFDIVDSDGALIRSFDNISIAADAAITDAAGLIDATTVEGAIDEVFGTGVIPQDSRTVASLESYLANNAVHSVKDYGAKGDGDADDTAAIQAAIDAAEAATNGGVVYFPPGIYNLDTTGLTVTTSTVALIYDGAGHGGDQPHGATLLYKGTGVALDVGDGTNPIYRTIIRGLRINAENPAKSSATAQGIRFRDARYHRLDNVTVHDFQSGTGIEDKNETTYGANGLYTNIACSTTKNPLVIDTNALTVVGGFFGGQGGGIAGGVGIDFGVNANGCLIMGTDVESTETGFKIAGDGIRVIGCRSEYIGNDSDDYVFDILAAAHQATILGHYFATSEASNVNVASTATTPVWFDAFSDIRVDEATNDQKGALVMKSGAAILMSDADGTEKNALQRNADNNVLILGETTYSTALRGSNIRVEAPLLLIKATLPPGATPSVSGGAFFVTYDDTTLTNFTDGVDGQMIVVKAEHAVTFEVTGTTLKGGDTDITAVVGDVLTWIYDGANWYLTSYVNTSIDMNMD